jgi:hypothetical protein
MSMREKEMNIYALCWIIELAPPDALIGRDRGNGVAALNRKHYPSSSSSLHGMVRTGTDE